MESLWFLGLGLPKVSVFYWKQIKDSQFCCFGSSLHRKMSILIYFLWFEHKLWFLGLGLPKVSAFYWKLIKNTRFCCFGSSLHRKRSIFDEFLWFEHKLWFLGLCLPETNQRRSIFLFWVLAASENEHL